MHIYTCLNRFDHMMCCIYTAWEGALKYGHGNIKLKTEPITQTTLFDEYVHVDYDDMKYEKVVRSIKRSISEDAFYFVYYASLSDEEDALDCIYRFLIKGFAAGPAVMFQHADPDVARLFSIKKKVSNEAHHFREFNCLGENQIYVGHVEPKCDIIYILGQNFSDRMPSEHWMIVDDVRKKAVVHPKNSEPYIRELQQSELEVLKKTEEIDDVYTSMWKTFFNTIAIKERKNYDCQRNMMPLWMRKHVTEFM